MEQKCVCDKIKKEMKKILEKYPKEKDRLIAILNDVQERFGYIPKQHSLKYLNICLFQWQKYMV